MNRQARILRCVTRSNWILLIAAAVVDFMPTLRACALGIAAVNFPLLARTCKKALHPPQLAAHQRIIAKYYLRFTASGSILVVLMAGGGIDPLGLFIGLSVVVASLFAVAALELTQFIFKEAV